MQDSARLDPGSFRDPDSGVIYEGVRVIRYFRPRAAEEFKGFSNSGLLDSLVRCGKVIPSTPLELEQFQERSLLPADTALLVEHPRIPFISYVYEWSFSMLKTAALLHLDILEEALAGDYITTDGTPYNIQFAGCSPVFIDLGSFHRHEPGSPWAGYAQFCRMFLDPLLFQALTGSPFQPLMRGSLDGIKPEELQRQLPIWSKLRWSVLKHVVLQAWLQRTLGRAPIPKGVSSRQLISHRKLLRLVNDLRKTIASLKPKSSSSDWLSYEQENSYSTDARASKVSFVERALKVAQPKLVWDLGCNTGEYSLMAERYADYVVSMDNDPQSVDALYTRVRGNGKKILPLVMDLLNPSPAQGWSQMERQGLMERGPADFVLCLALVHHLAISGNVPLPHIAAWLHSIARAGVIEFIPKEDPMVQRLLAYREDIFKNYSQAAFEDAIQHYFKINERAPLPNSGRILYSFSCQ